LPCICQGAQVFRNSPNKYPNGIYRALKNTEWNGLERIRIGHATDVLVLILPFRDVDFGASPNYPPEDSKISNIQTWQGKLFPRRLLAPQAINSKILAPGGDQGRRPYWESKTFEQSPSPYSGAHSLSHIPVQATFPPDLTQKHYLTTHTILSCNTSHTTPANRLPKPTRIHQDIHSGLPKNSHRLPGTVRIMASAATIHLGRKTYRTVHLQCQRTFTSFLYIP
jgi:hypothetical protein